MSTYTFDSETTGLLNEETIDYTASPYRLKAGYSVHCVVFEHHATGKIIAFYNGYTYKLDGRPYEETVEGVKYSLVEYEPVEHEHYQMSELSDWITANVTTAVAHNGINFDLLSLKLALGIPYTIEPDTWNGKEIRHIDTLVVSKALNPDRFGGHSLEAWGERHGQKKVNFRPNVANKFKHFASDMLSYCIMDVKSNTVTYRMLCNEAKGWDWKDAIALEKSVADIITRQSHRGFKFDMELAESNLKELDALMEERRLKVEPLLPPKKATKGFMNDYTPPKIQFKKNGEPSAVLLKWIEKHGGILLTEGGYSVKIFDKLFSLPLPLEPLVTTVKATIDDTTHIKEWLVGLGWEPSEWAEKDLSLKSGTKIKKDAQEVSEAIEKYFEQTMSSPFKQLRCEQLETSPAGLFRKLTPKREGMPIKVPSNPKFTVGMEKEICPNLKSMSKEFPFAQDIIEYLTYRHRRNSILGGGKDWEDEEDDGDYTGYLAAVREDGRIPTPADTCGAACVIEDTKIITDNGYKKIIDVMIGDLVLTHTGQYHQVVDRVQNGIKNVYRVKLENGMELTCTENHPLLTKYGWTRCDELKTGVEVFIYGEKEDWKTPCGFSNYCISNTGSIISKYGNEIETVRRKTLWDRANIDVVDDAGIRHRFGIGYLVLLAFTSDRPPGTEVCHRDGNPLNNNLANLYYGTSKENKADAVLHGRSLRSGRNRKNGVLRQETVDEIKAYFLENGYTRGDDKRLADKYGCSRSHIGAIRGAKRWVREDLGNIYKEAFTLAKVISVDSLGKKPTYDITVENAHSYVANSIVCHNTSRFKHRVVANIPRITSLYGEKMRAMFGVGEGYYQIGYDFSSLEARMESHYCNKYDIEEGKPYCVSLLAEKPNSVHCILAKKISKIIEKDFSRNSAKSAKYAQSYGCSIAKLAKIMGCDLDTARKVFDAFWEAAYPLADLKEALIKYWETVGEKKFILGIDGRKIPTRSQHALINSLFQSAGVICAKRAMVIHEKMLREKNLICDFFVEDWQNKSFCQQLIGYHDEAQLEVTKDLVKFKLFPIKDWTNKEEVDIIEAQAKEWKEKNEGWSDISHSDKGVYVAYSEVGKMASEAVVQAGRYYNLNVDLSAGYVVGRNWAECH